MKNLLVYFGIAALLLSIGIGIGIRVYSKKFDRAITNFQSSLQGIKYSQDSSRSDVRVMKMTLGDVKESFPELKDELKKDLDVTLRNTLMILKTKTETNTQFKVFVHDTTLAKTKVVEVADWQDKWTEFHWFKPYDSDSAAVIFQTTDSVLGAVHKVKRTFREWWKGYPIKYDLSLKNYNPNSIIKYQRLIQIDK